MNRRGFLGAALAVPFAARAHKPAAPLPVAVRIAARYSVAPLAVEWVAALAAKHFPEDPALILAIIGIESSWRPWAVGAAGEVGLCQVRPDLHGASATELVNIDENIATAARVLRQCFARSGGEVLGAVRRYNGAGPAARRYAAKVLTERKRIVTNTGVFL